MAKGFHGLLQKMKDAARALKREVVVLQLAMRDPRVSILPKVLAILTVGYLVSPIDLIPDFIPVLGLLDNLILIPVMIRLVIRLIPKEIIADLRRRAEAGPLAYLADTNVWGACFCRRRSCQCGDGD